MWVGLQWRQMSTEVVVASKDSRQYELSSTYSQGGSSLFKTYWSLRFLDFSAPPCSVLFWQRSLEQWYKASRARKQKQPALLRVGLRTTTVVSTVSRKQPRFKKGSSTCVQIGKELLAVALFPDRSYTRRRSAGGGICHKEYGKSLSLAGWGKD